MMKWGSIRAACSLKAPRVKVQACSWSSGFAARDMYLHTIISLDTTPRIVGIVDRAVISCVAATRPIMYNLLQPISKWEKPKVVVSNNYV